MPKPNSQGLKLQKQWNSGKKNRNYKKDFRKKTDLRIISNKRIEEVENYQIKDQS